MSSDSEEAWQRLRGTPSRAKSRAEKAPPARRTDHPDRHATPPGPALGQKKAPMDVDKEGSAGGGGGEAGGSTTALPRGSLPCSELCFAVCLLQRADGDALQLRWQALRQSAAGDLVVV